MFKKTKLFAILASACFALNANAAEKQNFVWQEAETPVKTNFEFETQEKEGVISGQYITHIVGKKEKIPKEGFQNLDEEITTFLLGYRILQLCRKDTPYNNKVKRIKERLEKDWDNQHKKYFNNDMLTLIILLSDPTNLHQNEVILKYSQPQELIFIPFVFLILEINSEREGFSSLKITSFLDSLS